MGITTHNPRASPELRRVPRSVNGDSRPNPYLPACHSRPLSPSHDETATDEPPLTRAKASPMRPRVGKLPAMGTAEPPSPSQSTDSELLIRAGEPPAGYSSPGNRVDVLSAPVAVRPRESIRNGVHIDPDSPRQLVSAVGGTQSSQRVGKWMVRRKDASCARNWLCRAMTQIWVGRWIWG